MKAWERRNVQDVGVLDRESIFLIIGRLRNQRYTGSDGVERATIDVLANRLVLILEDEPMQCQM